MGTCNHEPSFIPAVSTADGRPLAMGTAMTLLLAAADSCAPCQDEYTGIMLNEAPEAIAHLAGMAFLALNDRVRMVAISTRLGASLPADSLTASCAALSKPTQAVFSAMEADDPAEMERLAREMDPRSRKDLLEDVLEIFASSIAALRR